MPVATTSARAGSGRDRRAHEDARRCARPAAASGGAGVGRLLDRHALAGQRRLVGRQRVRLDQARVGGDDVAGLEQQHVARHDLGCGDRQRRGRREPPARAARSSIAAPAARARRGTPGRSRPDALITRMTPMAMASSHLAEQRRDHRARRAAARSAGSRTARRRWPAEPWRVRR